MKFLNMQGLRFPALGLGTWRLTGKECVKAVLMALELGYRHIDTAQMYGNEADIGLALSQSSVPRGDLFLTTKLWTSNLTHTRVISSFEESLNKLRTDYVDLLLIHWPEPSVPLGETLDAMREIKEKGKAKTIGVSNFPVALMREALEKHKAPIACNQVEYHVMLSQNAVLNYARAHDIIITAYRPLGGGEFEKNETLLRIGSKYGKTPSQVALRWLIEQNNVAAIPKAAHERNARMNLDIFDFALNEEDKEAIATLDKHRRMVIPASPPEWDAA